MGCIPVDLVLEDLRYRQGRLPGSQIKRILVLQAAETPTPGKQLSVEELAKGFKQYIPGGGKGEAGGAAGGETAVEKLVRFRGTLVDLEKLMEKLDK